MIYFYNKLGEVVIGPYYVGSEIADKVKRSREVYCAQADGHELEYCLKVLRIDCMVNRVEFFGTEDAVKIFLNWR